MPAYFSVDMKVFREYFKNGKSIPDNKQKYEKVVITPKQGMITPNQNMHLPLLRLNNAEFQQLRDKPPKLKIKATIKLRYSKKRDDIGEYHTEVEVRLHGAELYFDPSGQEKRGQAWTVEDNDFK